MKVLLTRFGGIGDCFPAVAAGKYLASLGNEVTVALREDDDGKRQSDMFKYDKDIKVIDMKQVGPWRERCVASDVGPKGVTAIYGNFDTVVDYMNIVENNSTCGSGKSKNLWDFWERSRNSNYQNWYDIHLAWLNINPTTVPNEAKRPVLKLTEEEQEKAQAFKSKYNKLFVIHAYASSLARSWYQAKDLVPMLLKEYPGCAIAFWNPMDNKWDLLTKKGPGDLPKMNDSQLRETMMLISQADLVVSVDTGCAHIAEGLNVKSLCIYSTVPAWTRNKYYKHQSYIDPGERNPEFYTFSLSLGDPLRVKDSMAQLSEREKLVQELYDKGVDTSAAMEALNTDAQGAQMELNLLMKRKEAVERQQSKALSSVKVDDVFEKIKELA